MKDYVEIDGVKIGPSYPTYFICEMSANHLQDFERAKAIIKKAKEIGANAVKLQSYRPDTITLNCRRPEFMSEGLWEGKSLYEIYEEAYMPWEWHEDLFKYAKEIGITIFSSPFDWTAVDLLSSLDAPAYKIASYEINDIGLIERCAKTMKPIIISTGIAEEADIEEAIMTCKKAGNDNIILLKCVSEYPSKLENINLRTIPLLRERFDTVVGLSDHSMGHEVDVAAVALGASVVEKHMTLNRLDGGADAGFSMEPDEFSAMIKSIRGVEKALGKATLEANERMKKSKIHSRSLFVVKDIKEGEVFSYENVRSVRPGTGLHTRYLDEIIGKKATCNLTYGTPMSWDYVE